MFHKRENVTGYQRPNFHIFSVPIFTFLASKFSHFFRPNFHIFSVPIFTILIEMGWHVSQERKCRRPSPSQFSLHTSVWVAVSHLSIGEMGRMSPSGEVGELPAPHIIRGGECLHVISTHTATQSLLNPISRNTTIYIIHSTRSLGAPPGPNF